MPFHIGPTELILLLLIAVLFFGVGRIARIGGELGKGIRQFREGLGAVGESEPEANKKSAD